ncbi:MAG: TraB/GumN family protein [Flavobacteriales bacterium]|nr:TraB/GumN family protein [Flavobacteriales bacterium]
MPRKFFKASLHLRKSKRLVSRTTAWWSFLPFLTFCFWHFPFLLNAQGDRASALLWKVEPPDKSAPSFLFGTIHLIPAQDFSFSRAADSALSLTEKIFFEMDISDPALQLRVLKSMKLDSGLTLSSLYKPTEYKKIKKKLEKAGVPLDMFQSFLPIMIQQNFLIKNVFGGDTRSYELFLLEKARQAGLQIDGLETVDDQVKALRAISLERQARMLKEGVLNPGRSRRQLLKLVRTYRRGDVEAMYRLTTREKSMKEGVEALLVERNRKWAERLQSEMRQRPVFVAVGAAHLGGPEGLIALLRRQGFRLTPIP